MFIVRPVATADIPALESLAAVAMPCVHTLPRTRKAIERAVEHSVASFSAHPDMPSEESYFFVLESLIDKKVAGAAAIQAMAGSSGAFFSFRNDVLNHVSRGLNIAHNVHALTLCSDLTGHSQLSGFFMHDRRTAGAEAALLSRARLLFAAVAPHRFGEQFFASASGVTDVDGRSPFWEALGRKFFHRDFLEAERMVEGARNRSMIVELMPPYPVYVPLLPCDAQAAMGQVHPEGQLPFRILSAEGFEPDDYIDIFDGGPILCGRRNALRSFAQSMRRTAVPESGKPDISIRATYLVATVHEENFRVTIAECSVADLSERITLAPDAMRALELSAGDAVLCVRL